MSALLPAATAAIQQLRNDGWKDDDDGLDNEFSGYGFTGVKTMHGREVSVMVTAESAEAAEAGSPLLTISYGMQPESC